MQIENKKIIVPGYMTNQVYPIILNKNKKDSIFGTKIDNIYSLLDEDDYQKKSNEAIIFEVYKILNDNKDSFKVFSSILNNINFIKQFINFYNECIYYDIDITKLPEASDEEIEIKKIIELIDSLNLGIKERYQSFKNKINEYEINNDFYSNFLEYKLLKDAVDNGCKKYDVDEIFIDDVEIIKKKATTRSKELDDIANYILEHSDQRMQLVVSDGIYYEDIARIFAAYKIPYRRITYNYPSVIVYRMMEFVDFLIKKDLDSLLIVLRYDEQNNYLCDYAKHFKINVDEFLEPFKRFSDIDFEKISNIEKEIFKENDKKIKEELINKLNDELSKYPLFDIIDYSKSKPLILLEKEAEIRRNQLKDKINNWLNNDAYDSILDYYNHLVKTVDWNKHQDDFNSFAACGRLIVESKKNNGDLKILFELLKDINNSDPKQGINYGNDDELMPEPLIITDMNHLLPFKDITIVVGANEGSFLPTLEKKEIIKEDYVSKIKNYPSLEERLLFNDLKMNLLKKISPTIVLSYCYSDYAGKEHKLSNYIEKTFKVAEKDFVERKVEEFNYYKNIDKNISKENAKALFVKDDNSISGSVSSIETYQNCPYQFFLQRGIGLSEIEGYQEIDAAVLGTLRHKIYEILGKNNFSDPDELKQLCNKYFNILESIYTGDKDELKSKNDLISQILALNEQIALRIVNDDNFKCVKQEYRLNKERVDAGEYHFNFNTIIDRIDENDKYYRVIDYKSSKNTFSVARFYEGKQLQLLTYLWLLWRKKEFDTKPAGVYYFNLDIEKEEGIDKVIDSISNDTLLDSFIKKNKLTGWSLEHIIQSDSGKEIKEKFESEYFSSANNVTDIKNIIDFKIMENIDIFLKQLYETIGNNIANGVINTSIDVDVCQYCSYKSICHKEAFEEEDDSDE